MKKKNAVVLAMLLAYLVLPAQSDLLITPYRVVFEGNKRIEEVSLANTGQDTSRYSISFLQYRMNEDGSMNQITEAEEGQYFADRFLRFFPRSVTLAPGEAQVVRIQLRLPDTLPEAEYRSHLYFRSVPDDAPAAGADQVDTALGIRLIPVYGITIPVIVRKGTLALSCAIADIALEKKEEVPHLNFTLQRVGGKSTFGDIEIHHQDAEGNRHKIGEVRGIAVYTPGTRREVSIPLSLQAGVDYSSGQLHLTYTSAGTAKAEVYAESIVNLQ
jgi:hypothetical protein